MTSNQQAFDQGQPCDQGVPYDQGYFQSVPTDSVLRLRKNMLFQTLRFAMLNLKISPAIISHIMAKKDVKILAQNLNDWMASSNQNRGAKSR